VKQAVDAAYRWGVLARSVAAAAGGYVLVTLLQVAFTALLPWEGHKSLLVASQTGYLWYTGVIIWCFAARTARRAWLGLAIVAVPLMFVDAWYLLHRGPL
jgi:hypothetical protein